MIFWIPLIVGKIAIKIVWKMRTILDFSDEIIFIKETIKKKSQKHFCYFSLFLFKQMRIKIYLMQD